MSVPEKLVTVYSCAKAGCDPDRCAIAIHAVDIVFLSRQLIWSTLDSFETAAVTSILVKQHGVEGRWRSLPPSTEKLIHAR